MSILLHVQFDQPWSIKPIPSCDLMQLYNCIGLKSKSILHIYPACIFGSDT